MRKVKEQAQVTYSVKHRKLYGIANENRNNGKNAGLILNEIVNGDCLDILSSYPDNAIDLTVFSIPIRPLFLYILPSRSQ